MADARRNGTSFRILPRSIAEALAASPLSTHLTDPDYSDHSAGTSLPRHRRLTTTRLLTRRDFETVAEDVLHWRMHTGAGLRVEASTKRAEVGTVVRLMAGPFAQGPGLTVACKVVAVIDEEHVRGFSYATLAGHVESGVQRFTVGREPSGRIRASVVSVSAQAHMMLRLAGPLPVWAQRVMASRYCAALDG